MGPHVKMWRATVGDSLDCIDNNDSPHRTSAINEYLDCRDKSFRLASNISR